MRESPISTLDVVDRFLLLRSNEDFSTLPGTAIHEFGERVREYSANATPNLDATKHPIYIGGWPSANFWFVNGDMILSSLLYSGQVLVRDPIADWFSDEQYLVEHLLAARPGYLDPHNGYTVRMDNTRAFLVNVIPALKAMRPLIDAGIVVLIPAEKSYLQHADSIDQLKLDLMAKVAGDPLLYSERFSPGDIAAEANVRGTFVFIPGQDRDEQIARAIEHGLRYFSREYSLATFNGATYTAAFDHELFLCREGINQIAGPSSHVAQAILQSDMPIFSGLTPKIIKEIHDDDCFGDFRAELHRLYQDAPMNSSTAELNAYVHDQEQVLLAPALARAKKSATQGAFSRIGASLTGSKFSLASGLAADLLLQTGGLATGLRALKTGVDGAVKNHLSASGTQRIWTSLVKHQSTVTDEITRARPMCSSGQIGWSIPTEPSMNYIVSQGTLLHDFPPARNPSSESQDSVYRDCECGSGRKFRFCCDGLHRYRPKFKNK
jgi:hypothetical protein